MLPYINAYEQNWESCKDGVNDVSVVSRVCVVEAMLCSAFRNNFLLVPSTKVVGFAPVISSRDSVLCQYNTEK